MEDWPRPNIKELPGLYALLDKQVQRVDTLIRSLPKDLFEKEKEIINFGRMTKKEFRELIAQDPDVMVIAFTRICGLSVREFYRVFGLKEVYKLRNSDWAGEEENEDVFIESIMELLPKRMHIETFLFTFYKMWEEHQKRHYRAKFEEDVRAFFRSHGYDCKKITQPTEVNGAIPPNKPQIVMQIRAGVRRDLVKRAKEFGLEHEESLKHFPNSKFIVVYKIPLHELDRREDIRRTIQKHAVKPFDAILFQDELEGFLETLEIWGVPKEWKD